MRVVAGTHRGRVLKAPKGEQTRPTSDRVREALFSILGESVEAATVLDLFAGSGALGIEALSRGAASAAFVDSAHSATSVITDNLEALGLEGEVVRMPVLRALACTPVAARQYDLVFIDPPYRLASALGAELSVALEPLLSAAARVVTESDRRDPLTLELPLQLERRYGDTLIRIHGAR
jgi:16S rRNA (guanine966-N2)-methyltransferase